MFPAVSRLLTCVVLGIVVGASIAMPAVADDDREARRRALARAIVDEREDIERLFITLFNLDDKIELVEEDRDRLATEANVLADRVARLREATSQANIRYVQLGKEVNTYERRLQDAFKSSDDYKQTAALLTEARQRYEAARQAAVAPLHASTEYKSRAEQLINAEAQLRELAPDAPSDRRQALASRIFNLQAELNEMEATMVAGDPEATRLRRELDEAGQTMRELDAGFRTALKNDEDRLRMMAVRDEAKQAYLSLSRETATANSAWKRALASVSSLDRKLDFYYLTRRDTILTINRKKERLARLRHELKRLG